LPSRQKENALETGKTDVALAHEGKPVVGPPPQKSPGPSVPTTSIKSPMVISVDLGPTAAPNAAQMVICVPSDPLSAPSLERLVDPSVEHTRRFVKPSVSNPTDPPSVPSSERLVKPSVEHMRRFMKPSVSNPTPTPMFIGSLLEPS
jgi:hypothetical protein